MNRFESKCHQAKPLCRREIAPSDFPKWLFRTGDHCLACTIASSCTRVIVYSSLWVNLAALFGKLS